MKQQTLGVLIASTVIGVALPTILYFTYDVGGDLDHFGSCLVNPEFRFKVAFDQQTDNLTTLQRCTDALGCWENVPDLQFNCFHSIPAAFQYYLDGPALKNQGDGSVQFNMRPGNKINDLLLKIKSRISWHSDDVLSIEFAQPNSNFTSNSKSAGTTGTTRDGSSKIWDGIGGKVTDGRKVFNISYSLENSQFFYINIARKANQGSAQETIFDSRLAPITFYKNSITFGTSLPSKFFYGIKGGQGVTEYGATIVDGVNTFGQNELPFYMVREKSGKMHGLLLETTKPFVAQVIDGPGLIFHLEGDTTVPLSMKLFVGPEPTDVITQFNSYMKAKTNKNLYFPPYWGLGLHLCRLSTTSKITIAALEKLNRESPADPKTLEPLPYDSDCISENLRPLFDLDTQRFPQSDLDDIIADIQSKSRRILPAQKLVAPSTAIKPTENLEMFILKEDMKGRYTVKTKANISVNYLSIFNPAAQTFIESQNEPFLNSVPLSGIALVDNLPRYDNAVAYNTRAETQNSRIRSNFSSQVWGTAKSNSIHVNFLGRGKNYTHLELSNSYGQESQALFAKMAGNYEKVERTVVATTSIWTESFLQGAFSGLDVPFTWQGLRDSVSHLLRFFMFAPYGGTPICGSYMDLTHLDQNNSTDQELCLRWFQVALLLPFARNTYGEENKRVNISRGPLDLNPVYQKHLTRNIQDRYAYNPYYYTLFQQYTQTGIPPVLPLSFYYQGNEQMAAQTFPIQDQFVIGPALLAAPLLFPGTSRPVYFPPGLWYNMDGELAWSQLDKGGTASVSALINYVPLFIRDGHILPTLHNPVGSTAVESRAGHYTLLATYPRPEYRSTPSTGSLYVDDGISLIVTQSDLLTFQLTTTEFTLRLAQSPCKIRMDTHNISSTLDEIRIFGIPRKPKAVSCSIPDYALENKQVVFDAEFKVLRLKDLAIDWCDHPSVTLKWESPY